MLLDESELVLGDTVTCYFVGTKKTSIAVIGISIAEKPQFSLKYSVPAYQNSHFSLWGTTERVGFEPTVACTTSAFEADALDHYATSPYKHMQGSKLHAQGTPSEGFEPPTLPLGRACSVQLS